MSGELIGKSARVRQLHFALSPDGSAKLEALAADAGMNASSIARQLLEELLPTIASVRPRLQVTRVSANGKPDNG